MGKGVVKVLGFVAIAIAVVALAVTGAGLVLLPAGTTFLIGGMSASTLMLISGAVSLGASLLAPRPKAPGTSADTLDRLNATMQTFAPRKALFGRTALATDVRDAETNKQPGTKDDFYIWRFIVVAAHKVNTIDEIWFDDKKMWAKGSGLIEDKKHLQVTAIEEGTAANAVNSSARMGLTRRYTGCAYVALRFRINTESPYGNGVPTRITIRGNGMSVYDPRKDSTVAGGSGTQRWNDQATWSFLAGAVPQGRNTALQMLTWLIGYKINGRVSVGKGIPIDRLDIASFMAAANVCDEMVTTATGTEPRYQTDGIVSEGDDPLAVVDRWKTSMNATLDDVDGQIRVQVLVNDLGSYSATFTDNDIVGGGFTWKPFEGLTDAANYIRGSYVDPSDKSLYQMVEYPEVALTSVDGINRWETVDYGMVQSRSQARRLSKMRLQRAQYPGLFSANFQVTAWQVQKGDIVRLSFSRLGFVNKLFRVAELEHRPDGIVPLTLKEENVATYAWDNSEGADPVYPVPTIVGRAIDPWWLLASGTFGLSGSAEANLLQDDLFAAAWTVNPGFVRAYSDAASPDPLWPISSQRPWSLEIPLNNDAARDVAAAQVYSPVTPGVRYYSRHRVAKQVGTTGVVGNFYPQMSFHNAAGALLASNSSEFVVGALPNDGSYVTKTSSGVAPVGTAFIQILGHMQGNDLVGAIRWDSPTLLDKEPGADVTANVGYGPNEIIFKYSSDGVAETGEFPRDVTWKLLGANGIIADDVVFTWRVIAGQVNGFTSASGVKPFTTSSGGVGVLTFNSAEADGRIEVIATRLGNARTATANVTRQIAAPATTSGGTGTATASKASGFSSHSTTSFTETGRIELTVPSGVTAVSASFNTSHTPGGTAAGDWTVEAKMQREDPYNSGTWVDLGTVKTGGSFVTNETAPGEPSITEKTPAQISGTGTAAVASGAIVRVRHVARTTVAKSHTVTGSLSMTSP